MSYARGCHLVLISHAPQKNCYRASYPAAGLADVRKLNRTNNLWRQQQISPCFCHGGHFEKRAGHRGDVPQELVVLMVTLSEPLTVASSSRRTANRFFQF